MQARMSIEALCIADRYAVEHVPPPARSLSEVLLADLLMHLLSTLPMEEHAVKGVCRAWRCGWADTLAQRPGQLRLSPLEPFELGCQVSAVARLDGERMMIVRRGRVTVLDQQLKVIQENVDFLEPNGSPIQAHHLVVSQGSIYVSHKNGVERLLLDGFPDVQTPLASFRGARLLDMALSADGTALFASRQCRGNCFHPILVFDTNTLSTLHKFGVEQFMEIEEEDPDEAPWIQDPNGLAILGEELFVGHMSRDCIHVFNLTGDHLRTVQGDWGQPIQLCAVGTRLFLLGNCWAMTSNHPSHGANIRDAVFDIDKDGTTLQKFCLPAVASQSLSMSATSSASPSASAFGQFNTNSLAVATFSRATDQDHALIAIRGA